MTENRRCDDCRNYSPAPALSRDPGACHAEPPKVFMIPVQGVGGAGIGMQSVWPNVQPDSWCGAFVPKSSLQ